MLAGDVDVSALDASFQLRPNAFDGVGVVNAISPLFNPMLHYAVAVTGIPQFTIGHPIIGTNGRSICHIDRYQRDQGFGFGIGNNMGHYVTTSLNHTHDGRFLGVLTGTTKFRTFAADVGFVNFNVPGKSVVTVRVGHVLADFVAHSPSRFVGHAKLPLKLLGGDTMAGGGEQVHGIEPLLEGRAGPLKGRSSHGVYVMAAPCALVGLFLLNARKIPMFSALWAIYLETVTNLHKVIEAAIIVWKTLEEVCNRELRSHHFLLLRLNDA